MYHEDQPQDNYFIYEYNHAKLFDSHFPDFLRDIF